MKNIGIKLAILLLVVVSGFVSAQIPTDQWTAPMKENYTLLTDYVSAKNYVAAKSHLDWLIANAPNIHASVYSKGIDIYEALLKDEKDKNLINAFEDSVLAMFDKKIKYFNDEAKNLNLKGYSEFSYWADRADKYEAMYEDYKKIVALNGRETYNQNIGYYMYLLCQMKGKKDSLDDAKILEIHEKLSDICSYNIQRYTGADGKEIYLDAWQKTKAYIDSQLEKCVIIDCDFIKRQFIPKYFENPADTVLGLKTYGLAVLGKCLKEAYFKDLMLKIAQYAPSAQRLKLLAQLYKAEGDMDNYVKYMLKSFEYGGAASDKADLYLELANEASKKGQLTQARTQALKALEIDPGKSCEVYNFIGMLYYHSGSQCKSDDPQLAPIYNYVCYLAAYEMFQKCNNSTMMAQAAQYFPTATDIFTLGMTEKIGTQIPVGCWIGGTTTLRKR
ncbi:MAG: hypothetical protein NW226_21215 [Microscillaceae bacterium]|nr:hypothetical protein [Microscillaceae bacterium]